MRIIFGSHYCDKANPIYKKLEVLQIHDLYTYETAKFVYSCYQWRNQDFRKEGADTFL